MEISSQLTDQPTLPPAGDADLRAALVPATQTSESDKVSDSQPAKFDKWAWWNSLGKEERYTTPAKVLLESTGGQLPEVELAYLTVKGGFNDLDAEIRAAGAIIIKTLDQMIPLLDKMEKMLSRKPSAPGQMRGDQSRYGLPLWSDYLDAIAREFDISSRTIQRRLHEYRGEQNESHPKRGKNSEASPAGGVAASSEEGETEEAEEQEGTEAGKRQREDRVPVVEESLASQLCKDGAHLARLVKSPQVSRETLIKRADAYLAKLHGGKIVEAVDVNPRVLWQRITKRDASKLRVVPLHLHQANSLVSVLHRHLKPIRTHKFSIGATINGRLVGAAICMRPACRALDDGKTIEVCRVATESPRDGNEDARNACSFLYAACTRIAREMGFDKVQTYLLNTEPGESLRGAGWTLEKADCGGTRQGKRTNRPNGHEITKVTFMKKTRWAKLLHTQTNSEEDPQGYDQVGNRKPVSSVPVAVPDDEADVA